MTSHPEWNRNTSALEVARVFSERIKGRNVVLTGIAPNGVGEATALAFASQDPGILILVSRTAEKLKRTAEMIMKLYPRVNVNTMVMDLSSQAAIRKTAEEITQSVNKIDILINNAGVNSHHHKWTEEKIEYQFGVNHLGPFLLTNLLMPLILKAAEESTPGATRIITLTSLAHRLSPVRFTDYNFEGKPLIKEEEPFAHLPPTFTLPPAFCRETDPGYVPMVAYAQSKTASILFTRYLKDHLSLAGVTSVAVNPGGVNTELGREHDQETTEAIMKTSDYWKTTDEGASTTMVAALDPALDNSDGIYMSDCQLDECAEFASDPKLAEKLWRLSEHLTGGTYDLLPN